jgi:hypothetical protein
MPTAELAATFDDRLFPTFLSDSSEYARAEAFWREMFIRLWKARGNDGLWRWPWLATTYADGTPFSDGDPIFSAVSQMYNIGLRVIQCEPTKGRRKAAACVSSRVETTFEHILTLTISVDLDESSAKQAEMMIGAWIDAGPLRDAIAAAFGPEKRGSKT